MQKYYSQADIISMLTFIGHPNRNAVGRLFKLPKNSRNENSDFLTFFKIEFYCITKYDTTNLSTRDKNMLLI